MSKKTAKVRIVKRRGSYVRINDILNALMAQHVSQYLSRLSTDDVFRILDTLEIKE